MPAEKMRTMVLKKSEIKSIDDGTLTIRHWISTEGIDDGGDQLLADGMKTRGKTVVLVMHGKDPKFGAEPWAKCENLEIGVNSKGERGIIATTRYFDGSKLVPPDNTGHRLYEKAKQDMMPNFSVGWLPGCNPKVLPGGAKQYATWYLLEYSQVHIGMNAGATTDASLKTAEEPHLKFFVIDEKEGHCPCKCNPNDFEDKAAFIAKAVPEMIGKGFAQDRAAAACSDMWDNRQEKGGAGSGNHGAVGDDGEKTWNGKFHQSIKHAIKKPDEDGTMKCGAGTHEKSGNRLLKCGYSGKAGSYDFKIHDNEEDDEYEVLDGEDKCLGKTSKLKALPALASKCLHKALNVKCDDKVVFEILIKSIAQNIIGSIARNALDTIYYQGFLQELSRMIWNDEDGFVADKALIDDVLLEFCGLVSPYALQYVTEWRDEIARRRAEAGEKSLDFAVIQKELKIVFDKGLLPVRDKSAPDPAAADANAQAPAALPPEVKEKGLMFLPESSAPAQQAGEKSFSLAPTPQTEKTEKSLGLPISLDEFEKRLTEALKQGTRDVLNQAKGRV